MRLISQKAAAMLPVPPLTPYLTVADAAAAIAFYQAALGATLEGEIHTMPNTSKIMHARLNFGGGLLMLADDFSDRMQGACMTPPALGGSPVVLALQVPDAQAFWDRAVAGGIIVTMPLKKQFWGEIYGQFTDPFGHRWSVSQTVQQMTDAEMQQAAEDTMAKRGTLSGEPV